MNKMGLDMYIVVRKYLSVFNKENTNVSITIDKKKYEVGTEHNKPGRLEEVTLSGIYWRKANAIHKWFVNNVQKGVDDCRHYEVSREQLIELKEICEKILKDKSLATELLPTQEGFFFGGCEYDEWYWDSVKDTIKDINELLAEFSDDDNWEFEYHSSW